MLHESSRYGIQGTGEVDVVSSLLIEDNGLVLQGVLENGRKKARPSNATADSEFLGFSFGIVGTGVPSVLPSAETQKVPAANGGVSTFMLANPVSGPLTLMLGTGYGGGQVLSPTASNTTAPTSATQYQLGADGRTVTVTSDNAGKDVFAVYRFSPTTAAARWTYGDRIPGNRSPQNFGRIGVITHGLVFTDMFDPNVNWAAINDRSANNLLRGGANGLVTAGAGAVGCLINGKLHSVPTVDRPYIGIAVGEAVGP